MTTKTKRGSASLSRLSRVKIAAAPDVGSASKYQAEAEQSLDMSLSAAPGSDTILIVDDADDLFAQRTADKSP
ncbi:MAG: hypothetical protein KKE51_10230 [Gammaproteobacteria bacterium]|nr:hypothetical protein [Gammaproteobacteria bacterium]MBU1602743.1 hypothetical protein [Gammaproteobacteria bacterium]MBU2432415.1 hypothetical protein [Gammaproteobacteria bacterium]MBU2449075.1 hypothetical protein [Gammaproteobacteria bacterium]